MAEKKLKFIETYSVEQFKDAIKVSTIEIIKNPQTEKLFFSAGNVTGAVSETYKENPVFSKVTPEEGGKQFWLLHNRTSTAVDIL